MVYPLQKPRKGNIVLPPEEKLRLLSMVDILEPLTREEIEELSILVPDTHFQRA